MNHHDGTGAPVPRMSKPLYWICAVALIAAVGYYVWTEHRPHIGEILFWVVILACPIIHLLMHRHHGHGDKGDSQ